LTHHGFAGKLKSKTGKILYNKKPKKEKLMNPNLISPETAGRNKVTKFVRYAHAGRVAYGILRGETIGELDRNFLDGGKPTGKTVQVAEVRLLAPVEPSKIVAVGLNYKSHLRDRPAPAYPGLFAKFPTTIIGPEESIVFPPGAEDVHYEGELVAVIGKKTKDVPEAQVPDHIFGVTAGNDVSERKWQRGDLQWFRAKGADTFGPLGPAVVQGLNYNDLQLTTRLNGELRQSRRTSDLLFSVAKIVSYVSQFMTLLPGDLIFTGTPGTTGPMKPGDDVEVEIEGIGVLRNKIAGLPR
jgi:2-keto-4-pentenoate hydratase/2-oxohepta-3-ene-1,7-dioic acid hydratase in catechol pathway